MQKEIRIDYAKGGKAFAPARDDRHGHEIVSCFPHTPAQGVLFLGVLTLARAGGLRRNLLAGFFVQKYQTNATLFGLGKIIEQI
jgi:hypothetical protein